MTLEAQVRERVCSRTQAKFQPSLFKCALYTCMYYMSRYKAHMSKIHAVQPGTQLCRVRVHEGVGRVLQPFATNSNRGPRVHDCSAVT